MLIGNPSWFHGDALMSSNSFIFMRGGINVYVSFVLLLVSLLEKCKSIVCSKSGGSS